VAALDSGADSYLVLPAPAELLQARIRALLRRLLPGAPEVVRYLDVELDPIRRTVFRSGRQIQLTATEFALLSLFLQNPDRVLSRDVLIEKVWGFDYSGNLGVLDVYVCYLRSKLEAGGECRLIQTIRGAGYVLRPGTEGASRRAVASRLPSRRRDLSDGAGSNGYL
jgi:two-component system response regulator MprA